MRDSLQRRHARLRNYPVIGLSTLLEYIRPEKPILHRERQRVASFSGNSARWYSAKGDSDKRPFGTQLACTPGLRVDQPLTQPTRGVTRLPVLVGEGRAQPYSASVSGISL
jgi:hypothetical protein